MAKDMRSKHLHSDDVPLADPADSALWRQEPREFWSTQEARRIWDFVLAACPLITPHLRPRAMRDIAPEVFANLAGQAVRAGLSDDVVGSLWYLAALRGHIPAAAALLGLLLRPSGEAKRPVGLRRAIQHWRRRLTLIDVANDLQRISSEFGALAEAADIDLTLAADRSRPPAERQLMVLAPKLEAELEHDRDIKPYGDLARPMRLWRPTLSPEILRKVLVLEFPHLGDAIEAILRAVLSGGADREPAVLLVGPPGIGKDALWRRVCELAGRPIAEYELAGTADSRTLRGTSKGWSSRNPSLPAVVAKRLGIANPCLLFTELDKAGGSQWNGVITDTLLAWIEHGSRANWHDDGLGVPIDLSRFTFGFSANWEETLPGPLRSRLRIVKVGSIQPAHVDRLLESVRRRHAAQLGIREADIPELHPRAITRLRGLSRRGGLNLRMLDRVVRAAFPDQAQAAFVRVQ